MRLVFKAVIAVLLAVGIGNYLIYLKTGQMPIRDLRERWGSDWWVDMQEKYAPDQLAQKAKQAADGLMQDESAKPVSTKVYKWTDSNGQVHYGDKPDVAGAEQLEVKIQNAIAAPDGQDNVQGNSQEDAVSEQPSAQSPLEKARAAADAMKARVQEQEAH